MKHRKRFMCSFLVMLLAFLSVTSAYAEVVWNGNRYELFTNGMTWLQAKAHCESLGGHLATANSAEENAFLQNLAGGYQVWLGGTDHGHEGTWVWVTGEPWGYTNWDSPDDNGIYQPDNYNGEQNALSMRANGRWDDLNHEGKSGGADGDGFQAFICEWEYQPVAPTITTNTLPSATAETAYTAQLEATGDTPITWSVYSGSMPAGLSFSGSGAISGTPTTAGTYIFTVKAANSAGENTKTFTLEISPAPVPVLPLVIFPELAKVNVTAGASIDISFGAENNSGIVTWTLGTVPSGITIAPSTTVYATQNNTVMRYTVTAAVIGTYSTTVTAADASGKSATATLSVVVSAPSVTAPTIITPSDLGTFNVGDSVYVQLQAIGTPPYTWGLSAASGSLPDGVQLDDLAGLIWGTANTAGTYTFTATASNSAGSDSREFTLTIVDGSDDDGDEITFDDHRYRIYPDGMTWSEAKAYCESLGGHLVTISSQEEEDVVEKLVLAGSKNSYWLGGQKDENGNWSWIDGTTWDYTHWDAVEPNYDWEDKLMMYRLSNPVTNSVPGTWNNLQDNGTFEDEPFFGTANIGFVCEWDTTGPVPDLLVITTDSLPNAKVNEPYSFTLTTNFGPAIWTLVSEDGELPDGITLDSSTGEIFGTPTEAGSFDFTVLAGVWLDDGSDSRTVFKDFTLFVEESDIAAPKITTSEDLGTYTAGYSVSIKLEATGTEPLTWTAEGLPEGLSITNDGLLFGTVENDGTYSFTATVSNSAGRDSRNFTIVMKKHIFINAAEITTSADLGEFKAGEKISIQIKATGTAPLTWTAENLPDGMNMSSAGLVYGAVMTTGAYSFTVTVSNAGGEVSRTFTLTIIPAVIPPSITTAQDLGTYGYDEGFERTIEATGTEPITWSASGLPSWLDLDSETGEISGITPSKRADASFTVIATNSAGKDSRKFTLTVKGNPAPAIPPTISTDALLKGTVGTAYNFTLEAGGTTPITWTAEGLPDGFTLNPSGKISGSPQTRGTFEVKITAANSAGSDSKTFTLEIEQNTDKLPPKILTKTLLDAKVGQEYSFPMDAEGENITWTATFKALTGFSITSDGVLTGTPESSGTYNITVKAKNAAGTDYANLTLKVNPADDNAEVPVVKSSKIPDAYQGEEYSYFLEAAGTSPMTWTLEEADSLPKGLELTPDGEITGEVDTSKATTFKFNVIATNTAGSSKAKQISLKVVAKTPTFKSDALKEAKWNKKYSFTLKVQNMKPTMWGIEGDLPDGVKFDKGKFSGKPTEAGEFDLTISASNGAVEISDEFTLVVKGVTPKIKGSFKKGTEGEPYKSILKATGVTPITWYFEDLPEGLDFTTDETGEVCTIEGTPEGAFNSKIQVTVENGSGDDQSYSKGMKMTIKAVKPKIKTEVRDVPDGVVGKRYTCQLELSTKNAEVIWSYTGDMPEGLTLDEDTGLIYGVPEEAKDNFKITVKVENANKTSSKSTKVLYITIHPEGTELQEKKADEAEEPEGPEFVNGVAYYERGELTTEMLARVANADEMIAAVLPAIEVEEEGMYEFTVSLDVNAPEGGLLVWHSFPDGEDDDGDEDKAVFLDETNDVIERVPETYTVTVSAWLEPGIIYEPVIAVKISE
ncbi:MAG: putative Ig domain-containing protein [Synergistaceae bacterium]|nr:putative Ig domain-containing protein [Synergistaceae bacterium]